MVVSVMLWAPSWGGMINGLLTLRGAWGRVRTDPVLKFFAAAVTFYGMATFEGPLLSFKSVNGLAHYTDWIIGHVHSGALGWNGFMAAGMFYWMVPRLYGRELWSKKLADTHFWIGTFGILLYVSAMWVAGITQGLMWRGIDAHGALLYPNFVETLNAIKPMYWMRLIGGSLYLVGMILMGYNLARTALAGKPVDGEATVVVDATPAPETPWAEVLVGKPVLLVTVVSVCAATMAVVNNEASILFASMAVASAVLGTIALHLAADHTKPAWHRLLEGRALLFTSFTVVAVLAGGVAELVPSILATPTQEATTQNRPYRPLELEGRDIYVREGCYVCHSQMIRSLRDEVERYGHYSLAAESMYDHPFQWGAHRTGPDLARVGGKYSDEWQRAHLADPRSVVPESIMPPYKFLAETPLDYRDIKDQLRANRTVGVPYSDEDIANAVKDLEAQANPDGDGVDALKKRYPNAQARDFDGNPKQISEADALIAYLQVLGTMVDFKT